VPNKNNSYRFIESVNKAQYNLKNYSLQRF